MVSGFIDRSHEFECGDRVVRVELENVQVSAITGGRKVSGPTCTGSTGRSSALA
jgi:hypothetical protein